MSIWAPFRRLKGPPPCPLNLCWASRAVEPPVGCIPPLRASQSCSMGPKAVGRCRPNRPPPPPTTAAAVAAPASPADLRGSMPADSDRDSISDKATGSSFDGVVNGNGVSDGDAVPRRSGTPTGSMKRVESRVPVNDLQDQPLLSQAKKMLEEQRSK